MHNISSTHPTETSMSVLHHAWVQIWVSVLLVWVEVLVVMLRVTIVKSGQEILVIQEMMLALPPTKIT